MRRGGGTALRQPIDDCIKGVAGRSPPATDSAEAKTLLDAGTINPPELERLKAKALCRAASGRLRRRAARAEATSDGPLPEDSDSRTSCEI